MNMCHFLFTILQEFVPSFLVDEIWINRALTKQTGENLTFLLNRGTERTEVSSH